MSDVLHCQYSISINGNSLSKDRRECIESIDIAETCDGSDSCTLTVVDPYFKYIGDNIFIKEASISIKLMWEGTTEVVKFKGYISAIDIDFPEEGSPRLSIFCLDNTHLMNRKKKTRSWDNTTNAKVIKKIAAEYGFKCVIQSGYTFKKQDTISQSNMTDIEFCEYLASTEREQFRCKLVGSTLYYVKLGLLSKPSAKVFYRSKGYEIVSFSPRINKETKREEVTHSNIDAGNKKTDKGKATNSSTDREVQGSPVETSSTPQGGDNQGGSSSSNPEYVYNPKTGTWICKP